MTDDACQMLNMGLKKLKGYGVEDQDVGEEKTREEIQLTSQDVETAAPGPGLDPPACPPLGELLLAVVCSACNFR